MESRRVCDAVVLLSIVAGLATFGCGKVTTSGADSVYASAEQGDVGAIREALRKGFDVNQPDDDGMTLLHHAALGGQLEAIEMLLNDFGAIPTLPDKQERTPLDVALESGNDNVAATLEAEG